MKTDTTRGWTQIRLLQENLIVASTIVYKRKCVLAVKVGPRSFVEQLAYNAPTRLNV